MSNLLSLKRVVKVLLTVTCSLSAPLFAEETIEPSKQTQSPATTTSDSKIASENDSSNQKNSASSVQDPEQKAVINKEANTMVNESLADASEPEKTSPISPSLIQESSISEIRDGGKVLVMDNGMTFDVPTVLKKRCATWQVKDKIYIEKGRRTNWYKLINTTRNEKVRVRIQTLSDVK